MTARASTALWQGAPQCGLCLVREMALFSGVAPDILSLFEREIARLVFPAGTPIYFAGDPGDAVVTLRSGVVKLVYPTEDGRQRIVRLLRAGDVMGLEGVLGAPYRHTAVALGDVQVCRIPILTLERLAERAPQINRRILHHCHRLVAQADEWIAFIASGPARRRVARLLLYIAPPTATGQARCRLPTREDMAGMLGITIETASRIVAEFRRSGMLTAVGAHEVRIDRPALEAVASG